MSTKPNEHELHFRSEIEVEQLKKRVTELERQVEELYSVIGLIPTAEELEETRRKLDREKWEPIVVPLSTANSIGSLDSQQDTTWKSVPITLT